MKHVVWCCEENSLIFLEMKRNGYHVHEESFIGGSFSYFSFYEQMIAEYMSWRINS
jgi:hypothetical protein